MDFQGRVGLTQLRKLDSMVARQRHIAAIYDRELQGTSGINRTPQGKQGTCSFYTIRVSQRDAIHFKKSMSGYGIIVDQSYDYVLPAMKAYRRFAHTEYPHAEQAVGEVVNLPCYQGLTDDDARFVSECARRCVSETAWRQ